MAAPAGGTRTFAYTVRDARGKLVKGRVDAPNQVVVATRLREMGLAAVSVEEVRTGGLHAELHLPGLGDRIRLKDVAVLSRQLATMISAGLSLLRALSILAEQTESRPLAKVVAQVRADVEAGVALSTALGRRPAVFPPLMVNMVRAGEVGGFLDRSLQSVAATFERDLTLRAKVRSAMTYPAVVLAIAVLAVVGMLLFIVPVFAGIFSSLGGELPVVTQALVGLSGVVKVGAAPGAVVAGLGAAWYHRHRHDRAVRDRVEPLVLRVPVFGLLTRKIAIARFCRNLGVMLASGVPLLQALEIVGETSGNVVVERAARAVQDSVRSGRTLAGPLSQHRVFPPMVVQMIAVGEDTGALDTMLEKVADFYDAEVETTTEQLTSLIEPIMIVVMGGLIGGMIVALYMPIFGVFDLVG
ncbi:type II secretion system F family protein [Cellulomonas marina]|uniref:Type IV pilus assembly protein PilC n=1 Tax=Cellulomonas marina TaxID=988821 RepID=A0A1I0W928_9CELL|nr:type II secretion system F family protein [Cellulomonas marina]GIG29134.1 pilus biosynthesis protein PilC [Cellulomonas marina]SFA84523.1 type IV pilus assembly protein PilC [Cellulomonas marina]